MLWVRVGAMDEVDGTSGVAHVLEHMMFRSTPELGVGEFSRRVAALGGVKTPSPRAITPATPADPGRPAGGRDESWADRFARNQWADGEFRQRKSRWSGRAPPAHRGQPARAAVRAAQCGSVHRFAYRRRSWAG